MGWLALVMLDAAATPTVALVSLGWSITQPDICSFPLAIALSSPSPAMTGVS